MIIPNELAQKIVDSVMCIVHRNVNIMNRDGVIIGTGHPHRLETFHKGAKDVIETGSVVDIYPHELALYPGALQGVNLPIVLDEQVIGVVGVFGDPPEVANTARLLKTITELILERELLQQEALSRHRLREQFVEMVLWHGGGTEVPPRMKRIAKALGLSLDVPRAVAVLDISELIKKSVAEYGDSELVFERATEAILQRLTLNSVLAAEDVAAILDERLVILKQFGSAKDADAVRAWAKKVLSGLQSLGRGPVRCGIGAIVTSALTYRDSYMQARYCLGHCSNEKHFRTIYSRELLVNYALDEAMKGTARMAIPPLLESFRESFGDRSEMRESIMALLDNNLNINMTAESLGIHRNTLLYRLDRLKDRTKLDPSRNINDAILCRMIMSL
jgi:carbohydrate diacid regulator